MESRAEGRFSEARAAGSLPADAGFLLKKGKLK